MTARFEALVRVVIDVKDSSAEESDVEEMILEALEDLKPVEIEFQEVIEIEADMEDEEDIVDEGSEEDDEDDY